MRILWIYNSNRHLINKCNTNFGKLQRVRPRKPTDACCVASRVDIWVVISSDCLVRERTGNSSLVPACVVRAGVTTLLDMSNQMTGIDVNGSFTHRNVHCPWNSGVRGNKSFEEGVQTLVDVIGLQRHNLFSSWFKTRSSNQTRYRRIARKQLTIRTYPIPWMPSLLYQHFYRQWQ